MFKLTPKEKIRNIVVVLVVCSPLVLLLCSAIGLFGPNIQSLTVDLCEVFTSHRVYIVNH